MPNIPTITANNNFSFLINSTNETIDYVNELNLSNIPVPVANVNMNNQNFVNLSTPTSNTNATTKLYVDTKPLHTFPVNATQDMANQKISNLGSPTLNADATTKFYVDDKKLNSFAANNNIDISTFRIVNVGTPIANTDVATKLYVDTANTSMRTYVDNKSLHTFPVTTTQNMGGQRITGVGTPTDASDAATRGYVDNKSLHTFPVTSTQNMSNQRITALGEPSGNTDAATKLYVDTANTSMRTYVDNKSLHTFPVSNTVNLNAQRITNLATPTANTDAATKLYIDQKGLNSFPVTASINANSFTIINVATPVNLTDAATKGYVDSSISTSSLVPNPAGQTNKFLVSNGTVYNWENLSDIAHRYTQIPFRVSNATSPAITANNDLNTGLYFDGSDGLGLSTGGLARLTVSSTGLVTANNGLTVNSGLQVNSSATIGSGSTAGNIQINGPAGQFRFKRYLTNGVARFDVGVETTSETGSSAGSNFYIHSFNDAGTFIERPFEIIRSTGAVNVKTLNASQNISANNITGTGSLSIGRISNSVAWNATNGNGSINLNDATGNRIEFNVNGVAAPTLTTRSIGSKLVLFPSVGPSTADYAIGIENSNMWFSVAGSGNGFKFYTGTTERMRLSDSSLNLSVPINGTSIATTGNINTSGIMIATGGLITSGTGHMGFISGDSSRPGYVSFHTGEGTRRAYIGWKSEDGNFLQMMSENGWVWSFGQALRVGNNNSGDTQLSINSGVSNRIIDFETNGSARWHIGADSTAESGSNAGSNFFINRFNDAGAYVATPLWIARNGGRVSITEGLTVSGSEVELLHNVWIGSGTTARALLMNGAAGQFRYQRYLTAGNARWDIGVNNEAETGSNAGSNFYLTRWLDNGTSAPAFSIRRSDGQFNIAGPTVLNGAVTAASNITVNQGGRLAFPHANQTDGNDGTIGPALFGSGLNIIGSQTGAGLGRQVRIFGSLIDQSGNAYWNSGNDGAGSTLDADLLDGQHGSFYQNASNLNDGIIPDARLPARLRAAAQTITDWNQAVENGWYMAANISNQPVAGNIWFIGNVEAHNSIWVTQTVHRFADTNEVWRRDLNNGTWGAWQLLQLTQSEQDTRYLRANAGSTLNGGVLRIQQTAGSLGTMSGTANNIEIFQSTPNADAFITFHISNDFGAHIGLDGTTNDIFYGGWSNGAVKHRIWHAGNDGAGSGLDSDLWDGISRPAWFGHPGNSITYAAVDADTVYNVGQTAFVNPTGSTNVPAGIGYSYLYFMGGGDNTSRGAQLLMDANNLFFREFSNKIWRRVWTDTNDGAGSGLDADLLDGQHGSFYQNASNLSSGTVPNARISGAYDNITTLTMSSTLTAGSIFANGTVNTTMSNPRYHYNDTQSVPTGNHFAFRHYWSGSAEVLYFQGATSSDYSAGLTTYMTLSRTDGLNLVVGNYTGNGSGLTSLNASNISSGTLNAARLPSTALTTTNFDASISDTLIGTKVAGLAFGAVGTYVFAHVFNTSVVQGTTYSGSNLKAAGVAGFSTLQTDDTAQNTNQTQGGAVLSGTWRAMGRVNVSSGSNLNRYTLFLRIS